MKRGTSMFVQDGKFVYWRRVILESPCSAKTEDEWERNKRYASACAADCLSRGESPYASHVMIAFPGVLADEKPDDRERGMLAGFAWAEGAVATVVYMDYGITEGMQRGIENAQKHWLTIEKRNLPGWNIERGRKI